MKIKVDGYQCNRCGWVWAPRYDVEPKVCPNCKRTDWNAAKKEPVQ